MVFFKFLMPSPCAVARLSARSASNPKSVRCARPIVPDLYQKALGPLPSIQKERQLLTSSSLVKLMALKVIAYTPGIDIVRPYAIARYHTAVNFNLATTAILIDLATCIPFVCSDLTTVNRSTKIDELLLSPHKFLIPNSTRTDLKILDSNLTKNHLKYYHYSHQSCRIYVIVTVVFAYPDYTVTARRSS
ncbi:hypothetical protein PGTUg99_012800 [Puccinia graminis f. sp. tritici]|uniref:Uncharacterized protein n=1 Tax=Puccinia graminis f. sp. tritici TaxID=56615 RepID=A0A5B0PIR2_PUCGR|nr:hypothetical protein PGTUg99_012800 [Puccinia graminis f. sp. tritici]